MHLAGPLHVLLDYHMVEDEICVLLSRLCSDNGHYARGVQTNVATAPSCSLYVRTGLEQGNTRQAHSTNKI